MLRDACAAVHRRVNIAMGPINLFISFYVSWAVMLFKKSGCQQIEGGTGYQVFLNPAALANGGTQPDSAQTEVSLSGKIIRTERLHP